MWFPIIFEVVGKKSKCIISRGTSFLLLGSLSTSFITLSTLIDPQGKDDLLNIAELNFLPSNKTADENEMAGETEDGTSAPGPSKTKRRKSNRNSSQSTSSTTETASSSETASSLETRFRSRNKKRISLPRSALATAPNPVPVLVPDSVPVLASDPAPFPAPTVKDLLENQRMNRKFREFAAQNDSTCPICRVQFKRLFSETRRNMQTMAHHIVQNVFKCAGCGEVFCTRAKFMRHGCYPLPVSIRTLRLRFP